MEKVLQMLRTRLVCGVHHSLDTTCHVLSANGSAHSFTGDQLNLMATNGVLRRH